MLKKTINGKKPIDYFGPKYLPPSLPRPRSAQTYLLLAVNIDRATSAFNPPELVSRHASNDDPTVKNARFP